MPAVPTTRLRTTIQQAQQTSRWLRIVARERGLPVRALARQLRTPDALAVEAGLIVRAYCEREAQRLVEAKEGAPTDAGLLSRLIRPHYARLMAEKRVREKPEEDREWERIMALHRAREERSKQGKEG